MNGEIGYVCLDIEWISNDIHQCRQCRTNRLWNTPVIPIGRNHPLPSKYFQGRFPSLPVGYTIDWRFVIKDMVSMSPKSSLMLSYYKYFPDWRCQ